MRGGRPVKVDAEGEKEESPSLLDSVQPQQSVLLPTELKLNPPTQQFGNV